MMEEVDLKANVHSLKSYGLRKVSRSLFIQSPQAEPYMLDCGSVKSTAGPARSTYRRIGP